MTGETRNDLDWLAMQYVLGEMSDDQRLAFESRLADDEAACDAVEQAVELSEAVRVGAAEPALISRSWLKVIVRHPAAWAACLLLAASLAWLGSTAMQRPEGAPTAGFVDPLGVSLAWAELRDEPATDTESNGASRWVDAAEPLVVTADLTVGSLEAAEVEVPQWLLTAVSAGNSPLKEIQ